MKKLLMGFLIAFNLSSCEMFDNRIEIAKASIERKYSDNDRMPARMVGFEKTDGESFESKIVFEPGTHKVYKLYYKAEYESDVDGFVWEKDGQAFPTVYNDRNKGLDCDANGNFAWGTGYQKRFLNAHGRFFVTGYVILRNMEGGWKQINE